MSECPAPGPDSFDLDGEPVAFTPGQTVLQAAHAAGLAQWVTVGAVVLVVAGWDEDVTDALACEEGHP